MKKEERTIQDINQETGVTPEQLWNHSQHLIKGVYGSFNMPEDAVITAVGNAVISVSRKMNEGSLAKYDYQDFKNYLFIALKNEVLAYYGRKQRLADKVFKGCLSAQDIIGSSDDPVTTVNTESDVSVIFSALSPRQQRIAHMLNEGYDIKEIAFILNRTREAVRLQLKLIQERLKDYRKA